jgi:hypothetical protein
MIRSLVIITTLSVLCGCSGQQMARTFDVGAGCDGSTAAGLDQLWTSYFSDAPMSTRGGCAQSGCHLDGAGTLQFSSPSQFAAATVGVASADRSGTRIVPGHPLDSVVYQRLAGTSSASQMPPGGPYLTSDDLREVAGWICAGAPAASSIDGGVPGDGGVVPGGDTTPPVFGGATSATSSPNAITLDWNAATDNVTPSSQMVYLVYQATSAGGESFGMPTFTTSPGVTSFAIGKLPINTKYYFVVRARDAAGNVDGNTMEVSATTPAVADSQPPSFAGASSATVSGQSITVAWTAATDNVTASSQIVYQVYQATSAGGESYATPTYTTAPGATSYAASGLGPNANYYFVVRAEDQAGNLSINTKEVSAKTTTVSLSAQVQPIFTANCASTACHSGTRPAQGLNLSSAAKSYADLVNVFSSECTATRRVTPGNTSASYLVWKVQGSGSCFFGSKMPKTGSLPSNDLNTIIGWVAEGAPNN